MVEELGTEVNADDRGINEYASIESEKLGGDVSKRRDSRQYQCIVHGATIGTESKETTTTQAMNHHPAPHHGRRMNPSGTTDKQSREFF